MYLLINADITRPCVSVPPPGEEFATIRIVFPSNVTPGSTTGAGVGVGSSIIIAVGVGSSIIIAVGVAVASIIIIAVGVGVASSIIIAVGVAVAAGRGVGVAVGSSPPHAPTASVSNPANPTLIIHRTRRILITPSLVTGALPGDRRRRLLDSAAASAGAAPNSLQTHTRPLILRFLPPATTIRSKSHYKMHTQTLQHHLH